LPTALDDVFATALAKSPADRYETCGALASSALAALTGALRPRRRRRRSWLAAAAAVIVAAAAALAVVLTSRDASGPVAPAAITQSSIAGARLGLTKAAYKRLFPLGWREDVFGMPNFTVLIFTARETSVYIDRSTRKGIIVTTWNRTYRTAAGVGPCSSLDELKSAYGSELKPSPMNTQKGKAYAYVVSRNLIFAMGGKPPNPSKTVAAVALYDGNGPRNDGSGVLNSGGTLSYAGFVALSEIACT
jgi:hypothetical protein